MANDLFLFFFCLLPFLTVAGVVQEPAGEMEAAEEVFLGGIGEYPEMEQSVQNLPGKEARGKQKRFGLG